MLRIVSRRLASASSSAVGMNVAAELGRERLPVVAGARTSACLVSAQNPGPPSFSSCQNTGRLARSRSNWSWGTPRPQVLAEQVDVVQAIVGHRHRWSSLVRSGHDAPEGRHRQVVGYRVGIDAAHHLEAQQQADERRARAGPAGLAADPLGATRCRPTPPGSGRARWARACGLRAA